MGTVAGGDCVTASLPRTERVSSAAQPSVQVPDARLWRRHWKNQLRRLHGLPLLGVGAGPDRKAPANLRNGELLRNWPTTTHTPAQIECAHIKICGAGTRTGKGAQGLLVLDVDGGTALSWLLERGCDPSKANTWQIHRNTDSERLKVAWRLSDEQQAMLGQLKTKVETRPAIKDSNGKVLEKGQAVELFHGGGQVVVLGEHPSSKGFYWWPEDMGPEALALIPECWWKAALAIAGNTSTSTIKSKTSSRTSGEWRPLNPCPICRRDTTAYCSEHRDGGTIRCFHGNTFNPDHIHGVLKPGQQITDAKGTIWALAKKEPQANGDVFSVFITPRPERQSHVGAASAAPEQLATPQPPSKLPASLQALIQLLPDGWQTVRAQTLSSGRLADNLSAQRFRFDQMDLRAYVETSNGWLRITDDDLDSAYVLLTGKGWKIGPEAVVKAILHVARQTPVHPVRDYLQRVKADPSITPYDLNQVAPQLFRAAQPLHVAMVRKWLIGAAARALKPGCQMDYCLVLKGDQGLLKSTSLKALAGGEWFTSTHANSDKDFLQNVHSCWVYELAELESITNAKQAGALKNLITTATDVFRPPYGRTPERINRQSVFCGTVNKDQFLRDDTGNRRFWVVPIEGSEQLDRDAITAARDAIWKAAVLAHEAGELPMLPKELEALSAVQNEGYSEQDAWAGMVQAWMNGDPLHRWDPDRDPSRTMFDPAGAFTSAEILYSAGLKRPDSITRADEMRLGEVLKGLGFASRQRRVEGRPARLWSLSQPVPTVTTSTAEVVTPQNPSSAMGQEVLSQPSQPFLSVEVKKRGEEATAATLHTHQGLLGNRGCDTPSVPARSTAVQSVCPVTTSIFEVVTPEEVVTPAGGLQLTPGTVIELAEPDGGWRNGWTVADVVEVSSGTTRYRIESGGGYRVVGPDQIRPCAAVA
jgi:hypothetical protein